MQDQDANLDAVWTYRGYRLRPSEFTTALVHFYRAEITRANVWRTRLDVTTNWALVATGAAITFAFSEQYTHHSIIILNTLLITLFLLIEARRYRYYELWSYRVRLMETDFYAAMLVPPFHPDPDWSEKMAESLLSPQFPITMWEALGRRLRRNYLWIYLVLVLAWTAKLLLYPSAIESWDQVATRARIGVVPGPVVLFAVAVVYGALFLIGMLTRRLRDASGEVLPRYSDRVAKRARKASKAMQPADAQATSTREPARAYPFLAVVTAEQLDAIAGQIQGQLKRKPTLLDPNNTTGVQATLVLPVNLTEIQPLKALVKEVDPKSVVVVIPANEVMQQSATIQQAVEKRKPADEQPAPPG